MLSPQSSSSWRPRAHTQGEQARARLDLVNETDCNLGKRRDNRIATSNTCPTTLRVFCDTKAVMMLTEKRHGHAFCHS